MHPLARDSALAGSLVLALLIVFGVDKLLPQSEPAAPEVVETSATAEPEPQARPLRLGVAVDRSQPVYDDIGVLLRQLGEGYPFTEIPLERIIDPAAIQDFDVLFLPCGGTPESWLGELQGAADRPDMTEYSWDPEAAEKVGTNLRDFVTRGGTLYVSDLQYSLLSVAFPDRVDPLSEQQRGTAQVVEAQVVDPGLMDVLGERLSLRFDLRGWQPALFRGDSVRVLLRGPVQTIDGTDAQLLPLLVKIPQGDGTILFTSFHNEKQENSEQELQLLRSLVFAVVTAREGSKIAGQMMRAGFSPMKENLLGTSRGTPPLVRTYRSTKGTRLQFVVGMEQPGAEFALEVRRPDGSVVRQEGRSTFTLTVDPAPVGEWTYTLIPKQVPYDNYPVTLTIGEE